MKLNIEDFVFWTLNWFKEYFCLVKMIIMIDNADHMVVRFSIFL